MNHVEKAIYDQNKFCNLLEWHNAGYTGKGRVVWNTEGKGDHGDTVTARIKHAAPDITVLQCSLEMMASNDKIEYARTTYNGKTYDVEDFIKEFGITGITRSIGGSMRTGTAISDFWNDLKERYNLLMFNSGGNDGDDGMQGGAFPVDVAIYVGGVYLTNGQPKRYTTSSIGDEIDFVDFMGVWFGTSFSAPYTLGKSEVLRQKYPDMTQDDVYEYFKKNAYDMGAEGDDVYYGWGIPRMGDVNEKREVIFEIGKEWYWIDGVAYDLDQPAVINPETGRTLVPIRAAAEALGAEVEWDEKNRRVILRK